MNCESVKFLNKTYMCDKSIQYISETEKTGETKSRKSLFSSDKSSDAGKVEVKSYIKC